MAQWQPMGAMLSPAENWLAASLEKSCSQSGVAQEELFSDILASAGRTQEGSSRAGRNNDCDGRQSESSRYYHGNGLISRFGSCENYEKRDIPRGTGVESPPGKGSFATQSHHSFPESSPQVLPILRVGALRREPEAD